MVSVGYVHSASWPSSRTGPAVSPSAALTFRVRARRTPRNEPLPSYYTWSGSVRRAGGEQNTFVARGRWPGALRRGWRDRIISRLRSIQFVPADRLGDRATCAVPRRPGRRGDTASYPAGRAGLLTRPSRAEIFDSGPSRAKLPGPAVDGKLDPEGSGERPPRLSFVPIPAGSAPHCVANRLLARQKCRCYFYTISITAI